MSECVCVCVCAVCVCGLLCVRVFFVAVCVRVRVHVGWYLWLSCTYMFLFGRCLDRALASSKKLLSDPALSRTAHEAGVACTRICARALVRLRLATSADARRALARVRDSLSLSTAPLHAYVPKEVVGSVIGALLAAPSPVAVVDGAVAALGRTQGQAPHAYSEAVRTLLALTL
ncbi:MAG: hypothetical protein P4L40_08630, partial [Terracidiphilus sp.]|nr:hypothetical protein [Terracidiphilus sp.]